MLRTLQTADLRVFFDVTVAGAPVTGLLTGNFTVSVVRPDDGAVHSSAVSESGLVGGLYYFDVPAAFWTATGMYKAHVVSATPALVFVQDIEVEDDDAQVEASVTWDAATNTVRVHSWLVRRLGQALAPTAATVQLFDEAGTALSAVEAGALDAQGVFFASFAAPTIGVGETAAYLVAVIDSYTSVIGLTFARSS